MHFRIVSIHQQGGGFPGAQVKCLPQPGAPGKTVIRRFLDHREGERTGALSGGHVPQDSPACLLYLRLKHPKARPPTAQSLYAYRGKVPAMVPVDIMEATVATVA